MESLWLSGRASERGIRKSEVRFLMGTQNFFFVPRSWQYEKHLSLFLYRAQSLPSLLFLSTKLELSRQNHNTNFVSSVVSALKIWKPSNSVSAWSDHKTGQHSCQRIPPPVSRIYPKSFNTFGISSFAAKDNFCLSSKLISVQLHTLVVPYTTND